MEKKELSEFIADLVADILTEKCRLQSLTKLLIDKGIVTNEEVEEYLSREIKEGFTGQSEDLLRKLFNSDLH